MSFIHAADRKNVLQHKRPMRLYEPTHYEALVNWRIEAFGLQEYALSTEPM